MSDGERADHFFLKKKKKRKKRKENAEEIKNQLIFLWTLFLGRGVCCYFFLKTCKRR